jgi:hypothetical protein
MATIGASNDFKAGHLHRIDDIGWMEDAAAGALQQYCSGLHEDQMSVNWRRALRIIENLLFVAGRHYIDDLVFSRLISTADSGRLDLDFVQEKSKSLPKPVTDILGRYVETNVALLTENRPVPNVSPMTDDKRDKDEAALSELTVTYMWEALGLPHKLRELVRLMLVSGTGWLEVCYDPHAPRHLAIPDMISEDGELTVPGLPPLPLSTVKKYVPKRDERGRLVYAETPGYGEITAKVVTPFEIYFPPTHAWNDERMGWVMREYYAPREELIDYYSPKNKDKETKKKLNKRNGWNFEALQTGGSSDHIQTLPLWWWERMCNLVEGPGPNIYLGDPALWRDHVIVRVFDRKPNPKWPKGRTIIAVGDKVLYDSPKNVGGRAYNPRWPTRWHPYVHFRWQALTGSPFGRALVTQLLPKIKRINAIDTREIMWQRTVPLSGWIWPRGTQQIEGQFRGGAGPIIEYDARQIGTGHEPKPIFPMPFPKEMLEVRARMFEEMEIIAGTEEILRGQRPVGTNSSAMLNMLRKQALASRSSTLQEWDEGVQLVGTIILQETIENIQDDAAYAERLRILAREKTSRLMIEGFSGSNLSNNVQVKMDTASMVLHSREARAAKAVEIMNLIPNLMQGPPQLQNHLLTELGYESAMMPQGADIERARFMISLIKQARYDSPALIPQPDDNPYVFAELFADERKAEQFYDLAQPAQQIIMFLADVYAEQRAMMEQQKVEMAMRMEMIKRGGGDKKDGDKPPGSV